MELELLAPGGSIEGMKAAISEGADAIYMGGQLFGARAYADNPDQGALQDAIDYCHLHHRKLYLTVNTLLKQSELEGQLYDYIAPLYAQGLDAVLVQDLGVFRFLREQFPLLPLHASTQMSVQSVDGARLLKQLGAERIVPAREISLQEIADIHRAVDIEIESFVHGALCYCYSGQCLMSSMIGGRSGNRGRCAQPCRQMYTLREDKNTLSTRKDPYLLSLKDISTLEYLPELIEAGVCSFKMEGRMKRMEYAAGVTRIYRKYLDRYLAEGKKKYRVDKEDQKELMDLYNRGGFSGGYYHTWNSKDMMTMDRPNHAGTKAAIVERTEKGGAVLKALEDLYAKDALDLGGGEEAVLRDNVTQGKTFRLTTRAQLRKGDTVRRVRCEHLLSQIRQECEAEPKEKITGTFTLHAGEMAALTAELREHSVTVYGECPQKAENRATGEVEVRKQLMKTGGTAFAFADLSVEVDEGLFYPLPALNAMRREALEKLAQTCKASYYRSVEKGSDASAIAEATDEQAEKAPKLYVFVRESWQMSSVLAAQAADCVILDSLIWIDGRQERALADCIAQVKESGAKCVLALPPLWRERVCRAYTEKIGDTAQLVDGLLLRCQDQIPYAQKMKQTYGLTIETDHNIYTWNKEAKALLLEEQIDQTTAPLELNRRELMGRGVQGSTLVIYGHAPLMTTAQCLMKNTQGCRKKSADLILEDKKRAAFRVKTHCGICTNIIYNHLPMDLTGLMEQLKALAPGALRIDLTGESAQEAERLVRQTAAVMAGKASGPIAAGESTRGHIKRGAE